MLREKRDEKDVDGMDWEHTCEVKCVTEVGQGTRRADERTEDGLEVEDMDWDSDLIDCDI